MLPGHVLGTLGLVYLGREDISLAGGRKIAQAPLGWALGMLCRGQPNVDSAEWKEGLGRETGCR